jgi:hypothetical protein
LIAVYTSLVIAMNAPSRPRLRGTKKALRRRRCSPAVARCKIPAIRRRYSLCAAVVLTDLLSQAEYVG